MKPRLRKKIGEVTLAKFTVIRARLHLINRLSDDLEAEMLLDSVACSLENDISKLYRKGLCVRRSAPTRVSTAVSDRVQQLATVCGTERLTEGL